MNQFFSEKGLTATSANHLANIAKELIKEDESYLKNLNFIESWVSLLVGGNEKLTKIGLNDVNSVKDKITRIANMSSFIAWVREAIKAKKEATNEIVNLNIEEWAKEQNIELPKEVGYYSPYSTEDVLKTFSIKELNEYYSLEAIAAKLGIFIHPSGGLSNARDNLIDKINNPVATLGHGSETLITRHVPSVPVEEVNKVFIDLQNVHREVNARLNQIKYFIEQTIQQKNTERREKYKRDLSEHSLKNKEVRNDFESYKAQKLKEVQNLKIIIPKDLEEIFNYLNNIGK